MHSGKNYTKVHSSEKKHYAKVYNSGKHYTNVYNSGQHYAKVYNSEKHYTKVYNSGKKLYKYKYKKTLYKDVQFTVNLFLKLFNFF